MIKQRYLCNECHKPFYDPEIPAKRNALIHIKRGPKPVKLVKPVKTSDKTWVITSAVSFLPVNKPFLDTLINFCDWNHATLVVVPIKYRQHGLAEANVEYEWADEVQPYLIYNNMRLLPNLVVMAGVNINPTVVSPLSSMEALSKGDNLIFGGTQLAMKTVPQSHFEDAILISTTGGLTSPTYSASKAGCRAVFNHKVSAVVIEEDSKIENFHYRVLSFDDSGFIYDLDRRYSASIVEHSPSIAALVTGDEHVAFISPEVVKATYTAENSLVNVLRPEIIARHDVLDFYSKNYHSEKNVFSNYAKHHAFMDDVEKEFKLTMDFIADTTPHFSKSVIVASNHSDHAVKWLNEADPKRDPRNALFYHSLMCIVLKDCKMSKAGAEFKNPFVLWAQNNYDCTNITFLSSFDSYKVKGIELAIHSHLGNNGSRGSANQMAMLGAKTIVGHGHSPKIVGSCYMTGTSTYLRLEYNGGPSSWANCHVAEYQNGKRTPIFIKNEKWRRA
jgi:hypothetical protein